MNVLYISSLIFGILGIGVGFAMINVKSALDAWWGLASIFSGGMLGLFLLGYFAKKAKNFDAAIGVIIGVFVILWLSISPVYFNEGWFLIIRRSRSSADSIIKTLVILIYRKYSNICRCLYS